MCPVNEFIVACLIGTALFALTYVFAGIYMWCEGDWDDDTDFIY
jgi:hypothetical protein